MRRAIWALVAAAALGGTACSGSSKGGDGAAVLCPEPGLTCNDGLCFNGAANGVCDRNGQCRTEPSTTGDCLVFLTSGNYQGNLGGLAGADAICQELAQAAGLKGIFKAWLSDSKQSAAERLTHSSVPYIDTRGQLVANDWADLTDGSLQRPITIDEKQHDWSDNCDLFAYVMSVWTATRTDGSAEGPSCTDWTDGGEAWAAHGLYCYGSQAWTDPSVVGTQHGCAGELSLYCVQQ